MNLRDSWRRFRTRRRRRKQARESANLLREFVYLDEVSVYSLMASKEGMISAEMTDVQASSLQSDTRSSLAGSIGLVKAGMASRFQTSEAQSTQILRKAVVQSTFKDLYGRVATSLALRTPDEGAKPPRISSQLDILRATRDRSWIIDPKNLNRGELVEVNVTLEAEPLFQARTVMSAFLDITQEDPADFGIADQHPLHQAGVISKMLDKLLVGFVPLRCRMVDYVVTELPEGQEVILHNDVYRQLEDPPSSRPLYLVGVGEQSLFWKDIRRVVFSGATYSVLARIGRDNLQGKWTPLKLVDVFDRVAPQLGVELHEANQTILAAMAKEVAKEDSGRKTDLCRQALLQYGRLVAEHSGVPISEGELEEVGVLTPPPTLDANSPVEHWREAFDQVAKVVELKSEIKMDPTVASRLRSQARTEVFADPTNVSSNSSPMPTPSLKNDRLLDSEIIAIYW